MGGRQKGESILERWKGFPLSNDKLEPRQSDAAHLKSRGLEVRL